MANIRLFSPGIEFLPVSGFDATFLNAWQRFFYGVLQCLGTAGIGVSRFFAICLSAAPFVSIGATLRLVLDPASSSNPRVPRRLWSFSVQLCSACYDVATMTSLTPPPKRRKTHSYRERIREVIEVRKLLGKPLNQREILKEAGGGSASTVVEELAKAALETPATLIGRGASTFPQRIAALEDAINSSLARERVLDAENQVLRASLADARADLDKLLVAHQDAQRLLLQGVDDLRQMLKAGQQPSALRPSAPAIERGPDARDGDGVLWKARHDQLLERFVALDAKNRAMAGQLHELGCDFE